MPLNMTYEGILSLNYLTYQQQERTVIRMSISTSEQTSSRVSLNELVMVALIVCVLDVSPEP